jgi:hypothetical protein
MTTDAPSIPSIVISDDSKSAEISEHVIVDETQTRTKNAVVSENDESHNLFRDKLFTIAESELANASLAKVLCPVDDYVYFDVNLTM